MPRIQTKHTPAELKNLAINGALDFWQEKQATTTTVNSATTLTGWSADMIRYVSDGATTKNYSVVRSSDVPTSAQSGFSSQYSMLFTMITGIPSLAAGDSIAPFQYVMEGLDYAGIHGKNVTYGFWIKTSVAGTYSFALRSVDLLRSYVTTFVVSAANTWEFKTITVAMDTASNWAIDNTGSLFVDIGRASGSSRQTNTLNSWQAGNFFTANTATNWTATSGATVRIAQLSIVEGNLGFGATGFERAGKTVEQEFALCQRYYEKSYSIGDIPGTSTSIGTAGLRSTTTPWCPCRFTTEKRTVPTIVYYDWVGAANRIRTGGTNGIVLNGGVEIGTSGFSLIHNTSVSEVFFQWVADARL